MDLGISGRVALVTASSQGIGRAVAEVLANEGARVVICGRDPETLERAAGEISSASGEKVLPVTADLTREVDRERLHRTVCESLGSPEILVLNTGGPPSGPFLELTADHWRGAWSLLLESVAHLCRLALPAMKEARWGRVVAITSVAVKEPIADLVLSNALRAGVAGLMKTLSRELGPYGVNVNVVAPGFTATERLEALFRARAERSGRAEDEVRGEALAEVPLGRAAHPEEIAALAAFLASERASFLTGTVIQADGGQTRSLL